MIRSRIHLIGGGPGALTSLRGHLTSALAGIARTKKKPLVAYVGAASGDDTGFTQMIGAEIERAGGRVQPVKLASARAKVSAARAVLDDCDVVFMSGGDVDAGMNVLQDRGVLPVFRALGREGRPMVGLSAGSIMLGRTWVRFPEEGAAKGTRPTLFACMGLAPVHVDAHAEEDKWFELRTLLRLLADSGEVRPVGYGLTRKGGICIEQGGKGATVNAIGTPTPRFVARSGRVVPSRALPLGASEALVAAG